jgi:hypothetical protein
MRRRVVAIVSVFAHVGELDLGTAPPVKAGHSTVVSGELPAVRSIGCSPILSDQPVLRSLIRRRSKSGSASHVRGQQSRRSRLRTAVRTFAEPHGRVASPQWCAQWSCVRWRRIDRRGQGSIGSAGAAAVSLAATWLRIWPRPAPRTPSLTWRRDYAPDAQGSCRCRL